MKTFETDLGYEVKETIDGLDIYDNEDFVCELKGKTLADYTYNGKVDSGKLDSDIKNEVDLIEYINNQ